ncbi:hypothetical protein ABK040_012969 [Willaertia magna]
MVISRIDSHAGSWYSDEQQSLAKELNKYFSQTTQVPQNKKVKAIISPHAGYKFSGKTAAHGFATIKESNNLANIRNVFVLGPCHRVYLDDQCAVSRCEQCNTPLGAIKVNQLIIKDLIEKYPDIFVTFKDKKYEEDEHSLEMQFPFIAHVFKERLKDIQIIPIMVGSLSKDILKTVGQLLSPYLDDEETLFVISSDFCHWGKRFSYQFVYNTNVPLYESIKQLDMLGVDKITKNVNNPDEYYNYMKKYKNTICGKNPILILLYSLNNSNNWMNDINMEFLYYDQSSQARDVQRDSSVSYVSIALYK